MMRKRVRWSTARMGAPGFLLFIALVMPGPSRAVYVQPNVCGGVGQPPCEVSAAKRLGLVYSAKPHPDAFMDPRLDNPNKGAEWWRCPSDNPNRTVFGVTASNACETDVPLVTTPGKPLPFRDPRNGGEIWQCPGSHPWRTVYPVDGGWACGRKAITTNYQRATYIGKVYASAVYISKYQNSKPAGAFVDPRLDLDPNPFNLADDEYWRCPTGFWRNLNPITNDAACTVDIGKNCDTGNIAAGTPWDGYTCEKKGVCGALGQRPCQLTERVPSCNSGLAESFVEHTCVDHSTAACLTASRILWAAGVSKDGLMGGAKYLFKAVELAVENTIELLPPEGKAAVEIASDSLYGAAAYFESDIREAVDTGLEELTGSHEIVDLFHAVADKQPELLEYLADPQSCLQSSSEKINTLNQILGHDIASTTLAGLGTQPSLLDRLADLVAPSAHALQSGVFADGNVYFTLGINIEATHLLGKGIDYYMAIGRDEPSGNVAVKNYFGVSGVAATTKGGDAVVTFGLRFADDIEEVGGLGYALGASFVKASDKIGWASYGKSIGIEGTTQKFEDGIDGLVFSFGMGALKDRKFDFNVSYGYDILLGSANDPMSEAGNISASLPSSEEALFAWPFDNDAGDANGSGLDAVLKNGAAYDSSDDATWLSLDGNDDYAEIANDASIDFDTDDDFSITLWVKPAATQSNTQGGANSVLEKWVSGTGYPYVIRYLNQTNSNSENRGRIVVARYDGSKIAKVTSSKALKAGQFQHVAFVKDGDLLRLFIDGVLDAEATDVTTASTRNNSALYVGRRGGNKAYSFEGAIDELRIYDHAISGETLATLIRYTPSEFTTSLVSGVPDYSCMTIANESTAQGAKVILAPCDGRDSQLITLKPVANNPGAYNLVFQHSNQCVAIDQGSTANFTNAVQKKCDGVTQKQFRLQPIENSSGQLRYRLIAEHSGKALAVDQVQWVGHSTPGKHIIQYDANGYPYASNPFYPKGATPYLEWIMTETL